MSESIEIKKELEATFRCASCDKDLDVEITYDTWGDIQIFVEICDCCSEKIEELENRVDQLEDDMLELIERD